ncbi:MAG: cytochrome b/b6 domain-containing protein [Dinoroseobacter sp.]|nr:cytochrome b/b6 domain-containing protein [Dinoroseobacter sp.]
MTRRRPSLVILHWGMAVLIVVLLLSGGLAPARMHVIGGIIAAGMLALRIRVRQTLDRSIKKGRGWQAQAATAMHLGLYGLMLAVVLSGFAIATEADLWAALINDQPHAGFTETSLYPAHEALTKILMVAIAIHVAAALWHQFVLRDRILSQMWFGRATKQRP